MHSFFPTKKSLLSEVRNTNRRTLLTGMVAVAGVQATNKQVPTAKRPIQLRCDPAVDPKREQEMLTNFENISRPTARRQPGFIDLKMLKRPTYAKEFVWNGMMAGLNWSMNATGNMDYETFLVRISRLKRPTNVLVEFLTTEGEYQQAQRNMRAVAEKVGAKIL